MISVILAVATVLSSIYAARITIKYGLAHFYEKRAESSDDRQYWLTRKKYWSVRMLWYAVWFFLILYLANYFKSIGW